MSRLILFNKPYGVLSQFTDANGRETLADYIDQPGIYPAGRLDRDSEGLLLLTDDGRLQHQLSHPKQKTWKRYWVEVEHVPEPGALGNLRNGLQLKDGPTLPARARLLSVPDVWSRNPPVRFRANIPTQWLEIEIREGRNRQVRRMTAAIGHPTLRLIRVAVGEWNLDSLMPGEWKVLQVDTPPENRVGRPSQSRRTPQKRTKKGKLLR